LKGLSVISPALPCIYVVDSTPVAAIVTVPSGCAYPTVSEFMRWNKLPRVIIYPNPTSGTLRIESSEPMDGALIEAANLLGEVCVRSQVKTQDAHSATLDLSSCTAGIYFLRIKRQDRVITLPVIVRN
jgi:hypothetical protein